MGRFKPKWVLPSLPTGLETSPISQPDFHIMDKLEFSTIWNQNLEGVFQEKIKILNINENNNDTFHLKITWYT